jgi:hypothetical protein
VRPGGFGRGPEAATAHACVGKGVRHDSARFVPAMAVHARPVERRFRGAVLGAVDGNLTTRWSSGFSDPQWTGRYVRMYGTVRGTGWGCSLWELAVYGTPGR